MNIAELDLWYHWPDDYMISLEENKEFVEALSYRSDDFDTVVVTEYNEAQEPSKWVSLKDYVELSSSKG